MKIINLVRSIKANKSFLHKFLKPIFPIYKRLTSLKRNRISDFGLFKYNIDLKEYIDNELYFNGYFEKDITDIINEMTKEGMVIFDIGANTGVHVLRFASLVGPNGKVYAFEPTEFAYNRLIKNIELNDFKNIKTEKLALSENPSNNQNIDFRSSWNLDFLNKPITKNEIVEFTTIDNYIKDNNLNKIDLIKIDIDGYEFLALKGGLILLEKFKPIIIIELSRNLNGSETFENYIQFLLDLKYKFIFPSINNDKFEDFKTINQIVPFGIDTINAVLV
jgi:FkbM family methyltransferase